MLVDQLLEMPVTFDNISIASNYTDSSGKVNSKTSSSEELDVATSDL